MVRLRSWDESDMYFFQESVHLAMIYIYIYTGILSGIFSGILSGICFGILSAAFYLAFSLAYTLALCLAEIFCIHSGILYVYIHVLSVINSEILPPIRWHLSGIVAGVLSGLYTRLAYNIL